MFISLFKVIVIWFVCLNVIGIMLYIEKFSFVYCVFFLYFLMILLVFFFKGELWIDLILLFVLLLELRKNLLIFLILFIFLIV